MPDPIEIASASSSAEVNRASRTMNLREHKRATGNKSWKWGHYLDVYTEIFNRLESPTILELGIFQGESLELWATCYPEAKVVGLDHEPPQREFPENVIVYRGRQEDDDFLAVVAAEGPFDVIIDDASHALDSTWKSFHYLFHHLRSCGFYVIEDWAANSQLDSIFSENDSAIEDHSNVHLVRRLINELAIWMGNKHRTFGDSKFAKMEFYENLLVITKR